MTYQETLKRMSKTPYQKRTQNILKGVSSRDQIKNLKMCLIIVP